MSKFKIVGMMALIAFAMGIFFVGEAAAGSISLAWDPTTTRVDGSPLTDLGGYKLYCRTASETYDRSIDVGNVTTYTLTGLTQGQTYYIVATAYDTSRRESDHSNEVVGMAK